ncbi:hypothetical protein GQ44DRAFT_346051 [Phaeosphaeriaceae sp. PMI808]|nr:hypothetical protein GQ44DRAFT_346051 [Phaeosphaeriaceae sp. PMI808]
MYCFPYPRTSITCPAIRAPYLAGTPYRYGTCSFKDFGNVAIRSENLFCLITSSRQRSIVAAFIQSWLFFGLASEALRRNVDHKEFLEKNNSGTYEAWIDIRLPRWFMIEYHTKRCELSVDEAEQEQIKMAKIVTSTVVAVRTFDVPKQETNEELSIILLSVQMLLSLLLNVSTPVDLRPSLRSRPTQVLIKRMIENGWCRKRLNSIEIIPISYPTLYFLSSMRPPRDSHEDHQGCTAKRCSVVGGLAKPHHRTGDCQCQNIMVPLERVAKIVHAGGIPLIRITRSSNDIELEVVAYQRETRFVAIFHVWADRQLGSSENSLPLCQVEHLESVLASIPPHVQHDSPRGKFKWFRKTLHPGDTVDDANLANHGCELFWLDTFCIPQSQNYAHLKVKAIESMNLIYAAASQTLVLDAGLQRLNAGQQSSSLFIFDRPSYHGPADERLLDVLAHICASNWMGRAWTLQEGVLSKHIVFSLHGSLAYLNLLSPQYRPELSISSFRGIYPTLKKRWHWFWFGRTAEEVKSRLLKAIDIFEPLHDHIREDLYEFVKTSLNVEESYTYARVSSERAALFVKSHSLLQSRSTTQAEDLPLILMNMSCMNGNFVSHLKSTDERMKLLFYGLGTVPVELLFSDCARIGCCNVDAWIPKEIVPEHFQGKHTLKLASDGFIFQQQEDSELAKFFLFPMKTEICEFMAVSLPGVSKDLMTEYLVTALRRGGEEPPVTSQSGWCILLDVKTDILNIDTTISRGARFIITRTIGKKFYLHFDCPIRLVKTQVPRLTTTLTAQRPGPQAKFVIEKSTTPQILGISRPQNPKQILVRIMAMVGIIHGFVTSFEKPFLEPYVNMILPTTLLRVTFRVVLSHYEIRWIKQLLMAIGHHAWFATYQPTWRANGRWRPFWYLFNYAPPIPFSTLMKYFCQAVLVLLLKKEVYSGACIIAGYWLQFYPFRELVMTCVDGLILKYFLEWFYAESIDR